MVNVLVPLLQFNGSLLSYTQGSAANLIEGGRDRTFKTLSATNLSSYVWSAPATAQSVDYVYMARAKLLTSRGGGVASIVVHGSNDLTFTTGLTQSISFNASSLTGPRAEDLFVPLSAGTYPYWRVTVSLNSLTQHEFGKVFLGSIPSTYRAPLWDVGQTVDISKPWAKDVQREWELKYPALEYSESSYYSTSVSDIGTQCMALLYDPLDLILGGDRVTSCYVRGITREMVNNVTFAVNLELKEAL